MREITIKRTLEKKVIVIVRGLDKNDLEPFVSALYEGGVELIEVTFNQSDPSSFIETARAISYIADNYQGKIIPGAGTVTTPGLVDIAANAGAQYIISPDTNIAVIEQTLKKGLVSMPGAMTPTEVLTAHRHGADFVKLFPVSNLGVDYVKAISAPISHVKMLAVGGITSKNAKSFLDAGAKGLGVGGSLVDKSLIASKNFTQITNNAKELIKSIK